MRYTYHAPEGDCEMIAKQKPENGRVDLYGDDGVLKIGNCEVSKREGGCSPVENIKAEQDSGSPDELTKEGIKAKLDELGIEYDARLGFGKLKELLQESGN